MANLPVCSGWEAVAAFERAGWRRNRQRGSHVSMIKSRSLYVLTVPLHRELDRGTLRSLIRKAGLTIEEFCSYLNR
ncbi:type II toxin-antitoxin system HicA family toxin [bacterium]|jgi:predicted RNA binding protein YcfA (HicA-like mRNA interferase family)|nr:type II toxin-antitoxin system HicA family toxin [bacterium]